MACSLECPGRLHRHRSSVDTEGHGARGICPKMNTNGQLLDNLAGYSATSVLGGLRTGGWVPLGLEHTDKLLQANFMRC